MARTLIVDDNEDVCLALSAILEDAGYEVAAAVNGSQVQDLVLKSGPDLILLDIAMPRVDGFEARRKLKADERARDASVIKVTARARTHDLRLARSLGARDYIRKPWEEGEIELCVGRVIQETSQRGL